MINTIISSHRFISPRKWSILIKGLSFKLPTIVLGHSILNQPIYGHQLGLGPKKVLLWSQMHGNESTTTRALLNLFDYLHTSQGINILHGLTLMIIPQLSPDGAAAYTRVNANGIDLNRDAQALTQAESIVLNEVFETFKPDFCFNLHGQRSIFSAGKMGKTAILSFLSPAADEERTLTKARVKAMQVIAAINHSLQKDIPDQIGRYDDTFNPNCVGEHFTSLGVPTILYEAGHYATDYDRDFTKEMVLKSLISGLSAINTDEFLNYSINDYLRIPENEKDYVDIIIKNIDIKAELGFFKNQELALHYKEEKSGDGILFTPLCHSFAKKINLLAHRNFNADEILKTTLIKFSSGKSIEIY